MPLSKIDKEYDLPLITVINPRPVEIDRVFTNLLPLLKHEGVRLARVRTAMVTKHTLVTAIKNDTLHFQGFNNHEDVTAKWIESDFLSLVKRGDPEKERVAAPLPMHLNTYKLRNPESCRDYGVSPQIFNLLYYGNQKVMQELRDFLLMGADYETDLYDEKTPLDIETLLMLRILNQQRSDITDRQKTVQIPKPLCLGQAQMLCDDIERLLAYKNAMPRLVLIDYIKNVMALHIGSYMLRLFQILPSLLGKKVYDADCENCQLTVNGHLSFVYCVHPIQIIMDMGENFNSVMAELARQQFARHMEELNLYVRAHLTIKKLHEFGQVLQSEGRLGEDDLATIEQVAALRDYPDQFELKSFFKYRIRDLVKNEDDEPDERLQAIQRMGLSEMETYIEMLHFLRQKFHQKYYINFFDSVFQKNHENGLLRQGVGQKRNKRRYAMGSGLLETLVQIAVLKRAPNGEFRTRHIRIDEFLDWLETRYGIYISRLPEGMTPSITELEALRLNVQAFKQRLREIGFYTDLSDAYVAQVIRPRYTLEQETA